MEQLKHSGILNGVIDTHIHTSPDTWSGLSGPAGGVRLLDDIEAARVAKEAGMRGIVLKPHDGYGSARAEIARKVVPGIEVYGGVVLNYPLGGLNPTAILTCVRFSQECAKIIWLPSKDAANDKTTKAVERRREFGRPEGISITRNGELLPEMEEILNLIAKHDLALATSHISLEETRILLEETKRLALKKVVITHVNETQISGVKLDDLKTQKELTDLGAYLEYCINAPPNNVLLGPASPALPLYIQAIRTVGASKIIFSSDLGQIYNPSPVEGLRSALVTLGLHGVSRAELDMMTKTNPARLLGLT